MSSASDEEAKISSAKGSCSEDELLGKLFKIRALNLSRKAIEAGYDSVNSTLLFSGRFAP